MIAIVDFGSQTAHLIGRRLRQLGVESEYLEPDQALAKIKEIKPSGIILSGGPASVYEANAPTLSPEIFELEIPVLGICYGWQLMAQLLGGKVEGAKREYGPENITFSQADYWQLPNSSCSVIMSHGDSVTELPPDFEVVGSTQKVEFAAVQNRQGTLLGVQFHPEADHTDQGLDILKHFVATVCQAHIKPLTLDPNSIVEQIKQTVGKHKVIFAVSGGVDSTVAAFLVGKAIGEQLIPVYVESGLMRPQTDQLVTHIFNDLVKANLVIVDARQRFLSALKGITDPEAKRKIIGKLYIDIFDEVPNVSRVVYDITTKPPATMEWE